MTGTATFWSTTLIALNRGHLFYSGSNVTIIKCSGQKSDSYLSSLLRGAFSSCFQGELNDGDLHCGVLIWREQGSKGYTLCVQEIPFTTEFTARTTLQQSMFICPLSASASGLVLCCFSASSLSGAGTQLSMSLHIYPSLLWKKALRQYIIWLCHSASAFRK